MPKRVKINKKVKARPKKITVKFFLNQAIQPRSDGSKKLYPLYMLITYNRKNTMLKSYYGSYYRSLKDIDKMDYPGLLAMEERIVQKTVTYEINQTGNKFNLKGLHKKYEKYCMGIDFIFSIYLKQVLFRVILRIKPFEYSYALNFNDPNVSFETLYAITIKIYDNIETSLPKELDQEIAIYQQFMKLYGAPFFQYNFPTVIEWLDGSIKEDYHKKLEVVYKNDKKMIAKNISVIDNVIQSSLA